MLNTGGTEVADVYLCIWLCFKANTYSADKGQPVTKNGYILWAVIWKHESHIISCQSLTLELSASCSSCR